MTAAGATTVLDLRLDGPALTAALCDVPSVSGAEGPLADAVAAALGAYPHLTVERDGDCVVARTTLGHPERVVLAGHLDTVPVADNLPTRRDGDLLVGRGTTDMKGGVAVALRLAATIAAPTREVTYIFYDHEEVAAEHNGLGRLARNRPDLLEGDFAVLLEPTSALVEGGCNGTMLVDVVVPGRAAHTARSWMGENAIHASATVLDRLRAYEAGEIEVDGLVFREGLNAVAISGGIAGNVVPDRAVVSVNYRFAPSHTEESALHHLHTVFDGFEVVLVDSAPGARPGLDHPSAQAFLAAVGGEPRAKLGWTDVSRFSALGVPAVNYGPGDPLVAHADDERVDVREVTACEERLRAWLQS